MLLSSAFTFVPAVNATTPNESSEADCEIVPLYALDVRSTFVGEYESEVIDEDYEAYYAKYIIPIVVAADEEFQQISYWVPWDINGLSWKDAIINIVERADKYIYMKYGIDFKIVGFTTWESDDELTEGEDRLHELADELNWNSKTRGKTILAGFTGQTITYHDQELYGCSFNQTLNSTKVCLIKPSAYWIDDNTFHHEISWNIGAEELSHITCLDDDCVMSYKTTFVHYVVEDGWLWLVENEVYVAMLTHHYCTRCETIILEGVKPYRNYMQGRRSCGYGCFGQLPIAVFPK